MKTVMTYIYILYIYRYSLQHPRSEFKTKKKTHRAIQRNIIKIHIYVDQADNMSFTLQYKSDRNHYKFKRKI